MYHLDPSEHACGGHTEVQISYHLCCGWLIDVGRTAARKVICKREQCSIVRNIAKKKMAYHVITVTTKMKHIVIDFSYSYM